MWRDGSSLNRSGDDLIDGRGGDDFVSAAA
jgi:hypothetical protein